MILVYLREYKQDVTNQAVGRIEVHLGPGDIWSISPLPAW